MTTEELVQLIRQSGRKPIERGTLYNVIREFDEVASPSEAMTL
jgi:2-iminoacetate synthase ThiH